MPRPSPRTNRTRGRPRPSQCPPQSKCARCSSRPARCPPPPPPNPPRAQPLCDAAADEQRPARCAGLCSHGRDPDRADVRHRLRRAPRRRRRRGPPGPPPAPRGGGAAGFLDPCGVADLADFGRRLRRSSGCCSPLCATRSPSPGSLSSRTPSAAATCLPLPARPKPSPPARHQTHRQSFRKPATPVSKGNSSVERQLQCRNEPRPMPPPARSAREAHAVAPVCPRPAAPARPHGAAPVDSLKSTTRRGAAAGGCGARGGGPSSAARACARRRAHASRPSPRTKWTCRVPHPVLIGHAAARAPRSALSRARGGAPGPFRRRRGRCRRRRPAPDVQPPPPSPAPSSARRAPRVCAQLLLSAARRRYVAAMQPLNALVHARPRGGAARKWALHTEFR